MTDSIHQGNQQSWLRQYYFSRNFSSSRFYGLFPHLSLPGILIFGSHFC